jgi:hypothetical protein
MKVSAAEIAENFKRDADQAMAETRFDHSERK